MGEGDYLPSGRGPVKKADPERIKKIKEGGKKADEIREKAIQFENEHEIPKAEEDLLKELEEINGNEKNDK